MAVDVELGPRSYTVHFRPLSSVPVHMQEAGLEPGRCLIVTDENVAEHYRVPLERTVASAGWTPETVVLPPGETTKSATHLHTIYDRALEWGIDRSTPVLALGGGVIGDLAGFAAATLLRGVPLVQLPTSLLAQVDASVGGKTAINHETGKNLIGAFYQPELVCADPTTLDTLPAREFAGGMSEVVKHALIKDASLFEALESDLKILLSERDGATASAIIERAVRVKADVVRADEREEGKRALLNFGHTYAHALEQASGYGAFTHGEAVAVGMRAALHLSHRRHPDALPRERIENLLQTLPVAGDPSSVAFDDLYAAMSADKKNRGETIRFVLLRRVGEAYVTGDVSREEVENAWDNACPP